MIIQIQWICMFIENGSLNGTCDSGRSHIWSANVIFYKPATSLRSAFHVFANRLFKIARNYQFLGEALLSHCPYSNVPVSESQSNICMTDSSGRSFEVDTIRSGFWGCSYGLSMPVKSLISPFKALLYKPFVSRSMQISRVASINISL